MLARAERRTTALLPVISRRSASPGEPARRILRPGQRASSQAFAPATRATQPVLRRRRRLVSPRSHRADSAELTLPWKPIVAQVGACLLRRPDDGGGSRRWRRWPAAAAAADVAPPRAPARGSGDRRGCGPRRRWAGQGALGARARREADTVGRRGHAQPSCSVRVPCSVGKPRRLVHVQRTLTRAVRRWFACGFTSRKRSPQNPCINIRLCHSASADGVWSL